ncbi:MAG: hypothetical protein V6008_00115 [Candidatus Dasytiphilus stammeri]
MKFNNKEIFIQLLYIFPGPGSVTNETDFYISRQAWAQNEISIIGVCFGFQGLASLLLRC